MSEEKIIPKVCTMHLFTSFDDLKTILEKANRVDRLDIFNLPNKSDFYYNKNDNNTASSLTNVLLDIERDEEWRMTQYGKSPHFFIEKDRGCIIFSDGESSSMTLLDIDGAIIIAELQSIIIIPGIETIKGGFFRPNEVIRLVNLLNDAILHCKLIDVPVEGKEGLYKIGYDYQIITNND